MIKKKYHVRAGSACYRLFLDKESLQETVSSTAAKVMQTQAEVQT